MSVDDHRRTCISDFASVLLWHVRSTLLDEGRSAASLSGVRFSARTGGSPSSHPRRLSPDTGRIPVRVNRCDR